MTNQQLLDRIDRLGEYAAASLRCARQSGRVNDPRLYQLFLGNAGCYNQAAGLFALDLNLARFIDHEFRPEDERIGLPPDRALALVPDHVENFLHSFTAAAA